VRHDLALPGLPRAKVLATVVRLLETTRMRVGNHETRAKASRSDSLPCVHAKCDSRARPCNFASAARAACGTHSRISDRQLASIVRRMRDLPGYDLFQYVDERGEMRAVDSAEVNAYLKRIAGDEFTSKDFRTWADTVLRDRRPKPRSLVPLLKKSLRRLRRRSGTQLAAAHRFL
jgi:DNA topoisomerase-1